jgi:hypothetical protein
MPLLFIPRETRNTYKVTTCLSFVTRPDQTRPTSKCSVQHSVNLKYLLSALGSFMCMRTSTHLLWNQLVWKNVKL